MMWSLWLAVLCLTIVHTKAGDGFLAQDVNSLPDADQGQSAQDNIQQSRDASSAKKGDEKAADEGSPLELTTEDGLVAESSKDATDSTPTGNMDGAMGLLHQRLASEEQFNQRLQQLLAKSSSDIRNKQEQLVVVQEQLAVAVQSQRNLKTSLMSKLKKEKDEIIQERTHTKAAAKQLRTAGRMIDTEHNTIMLLRDRMGTVLAHLRNVTHLGRVMEGELADEKIKENIKNHQLNVLQHEATLQQRVPLQWEAKFHEVESSKAKEDARLKAMEHQNFLLRQRIASLNKRDKIFSNENLILRKQLTGKDLAVQKEVAQLQRFKGALAEAQKSNIQLQDKYADSLKSLMIARGDGALDASSLSSDLSDPSIASSDGVDPVQDASLLVQLKHDSQRLKSVMSRKRKSGAVEVHASTVPVDIPPETARSSKSQLELTHDSQGLTTLLNRMSNSTEGRATATKR